MSVISLEIAGGPLDATVTVPGSKSLTNRALVAAALGNGKSVLTGALFSDDTEYMMDVLVRLGFEVIGDAARERIEVHGRGGHVPGTGADCFCGNSGTTIRFCAALACLGGGVYRLDGTTRMRERPIGALVDALRRLGALIEYEGEEGFPPLTVRASGLPGGTVTFDEPPSSQFISAVMLAAPCARSDVMIDVRGSLVSQPYVSMTSAVMGEFGATVIEDVGDDGAKFIIAAPQAYRSREYAVEPDASNASYFLAAAAVAGGRVTVQGLGEGSVQGDARFVEVLERMGCSVVRSRDSLTVEGPGDGSKLRGVDVDLNSMPDMVQTLSVVALFASGRTRISNVGNLRLKETDRLSALAAELTALGATVGEESDGLVIEPPEQVRAATIKTYDDHRMAMSFALAGLVVEGLEIADPECVSKTFPDFFDRWRLLTESGSTGES